MQDVIDTTDLIATQRALRDRLLSRRSAIPCESARNLAAHMLLYLDDPLVCLRLGAEMILHVTDSDRVDAGFTELEAAYYCPSVEVKRNNVEIPSVIKTAFCASDRSIQDVLNSDRPVVFDDILCDARIGPRVRDQLSRLGARRKLAVTLLDAGMPIGMLCVDRVVARDSWNQAAYTAFESIANTVLTPIVAASLRFRSATSKQDNAGINLRAFGLTFAELKVARLVVEGCSYKEIARCLDRSVATIDHHLRSIRGKLGVASTSKLVSALNKSIVKRDRATAVVS